MHSGVVDFLGLPAPDACRTHRFHGDFHHCGKRHHRVCASLQEVCQEQEISGKLPVAKNLKFSKKIGLDT